MSGDAALVLRHTALVLDQTRAAAIEDNRAHMEDMTAASRLLPRSAAQLDALAMGSALGMSMAIAASAALPRSAAQMGNSGSGQACKSNEWCARCRAAPIRWSTERTGAGRHRACRAKDGLCGDCKKGNK